MDCKRVPALIACFLLFFTDFAASFAADTLSSKFPVAILVQLRSEHSRIEAATRARDYKALEEIKKDALGERAAMVNDFSDHFNYCPVYYYMDTNLHFIMDRNFANVLLDSNGLPAKNLVINDTSTRYYIVFYGYATSQTRKPKAHADNESGSWVTAGKGLIINNYKFQQISFFYSASTDFYSFLSDNINKKSKFGKYGYQSKKYDIEYFPYALRFSMQLYDNFGKVFIEDTAPCIDSSALTIEAGKPGHKRRHKGKAKVIKR